jgi:hypothetical protein
MKRTAARDFRADIFSNCRQHSARYRSRVLTNDEQRQHALGQIRGKCEHCSKDDDGRGVTVNVGSIVPALRYFAIVLRDSPVRRLISRIDCFSRSAIRRMMFKSPMWITPLPPSLTALGGRFTWLNSQWKLCA